MACSAKQRNSRGGGQGCRSDPRGGFLPGACGLCGAGNGGSRAPRAGGCCEKAAVQSVDIYIVILFANSLSDFVVRTDHGSLAWL